MRTSLFPADQARRAAAVLLAASRTKTRRLVVWAAPLGRMAFTNYLAQSVIFGFIFYGYGFGLFGRIGVAAALAIGSLVYALQALASTWWLRRFCYGPLEWLWRSATYLRWQPLRTQRVAG